MINGIRLFLLFFPLLVFSQTRVGQWKSYPSSLIVRQTIEIDNLLVSATSGGILIYDRNTLTFETITNIEGLVETDLSVIDVDKNGHLWLGSAEPKGVIQIYDLKNRKSIKTFNFDLWQITALSVSDSVVFSAYSKDGEWGILEFILQEDEFRYRQIYKPSEENLEFISSIAIIGDNLYVGTNKGLFIGNYRKYILNYPQNWNKVVQLDNKNISKLRKDDLGIIAIANGEIWKIDEEIKLLNDIYKDRTYIRDVIRDDNDTITLLTKWKLVNYSQSGQLLGSWDIKHEPLSFIKLVSGDFLISSNKGIAIWGPNREKFEWRLPNGPLSNIYTAMSVMKDGRLVAAGPEGISILNENGWYNLIPSEQKWAIFSHKAEDYSEFVADTAQFRPARAWSMEEEDDGFWISLQGVIPARNNFDEPIGGGLINFFPDDPGAMVIYDTTAGQISPTNDMGYMNVRGLTVDNQSFLWISNFGSGDLDSKIIVRDNQGNWLQLQQTGNGGINQKINNPTEILRPEDQIAIFGSSKDDGLFILEMDRDSDGDGNPDVIDIDSDGDGILNNEDPDDDNDGIPDEQDLLPAKWRNFSTIHGLSDNTVWSLGRDSEGQIWALTARGLQRLDFNESYTTLTPFFFTYFAGVPFGEGSKIKIDGRDNIWASSITKGLYVLLENSTPWPDWGGFRKDNSMLLSDEVTAVAIDNLRGLAYISTSKGINSLKIPFAKKKKSFSNIKIFPSPYRIPSSEPMVLDGLKDNSSLKIMTLSGEVIRQIKYTSPSVQGYQAFWDGRTKGGEWVSTGIYLIAIYSKNGESKVEKIAVIRE